MGNSKLSENAIKIAKNRYFINGETWQDLSRRVGGIVAATETIKKQFYEDRFAEMIYNLDFLPGGRILRNAGRPRGSMFNCYVLPIGDSREEIGQYYKDSLILWGEGGGVGVNISSLRPHGAEIKGVGGSSSGPVSFLIAGDAIAETVESGGSRRAAALALMHVEHPDILRFINAKMVDGKLPHFNISVAVSEAFLEAVESHASWEFRFAQKPFGTIDSREIWDTIMANMVAHAEPGLLNWDKLSKNNSYYYDPIVGCNPCGEAILEPYGVCDLGSLVLPNFITGTVNTNWKKLEETIRLAVRFLDNVIEVNKYVLKEIDIKAHNSRRIGIGMMGMAEYLFAKGLRYGSPRSIVEIERLMRFIRDAVYTATIELADEKGAFPKFDPVAYGKASFIRKLPAQLRMDIKNRGVRNVTSMAIAPTGTISLLADVTSGIEPLPFKAYMRNDRVGERMYVHPIYKKSIELSQAIPEWFVDTKDLTPAEHFEVQSVIQKYVDGAVSKTINMPKGTTPDQLSNLMLEYIHDLKGVTVYVDGSKDGQILNSVSEDEVRAYLVSNGIIETGIDESTTRCTTGKCEL
jgi:ribonucleoside-diphosphate reductase alpha chain